MGKLTNPYINPDLYSLYYYPKGLCWQVTHEKSGVTNSFKSEVLAIKSVLDVNGTFDIEEAIMYA